MEDKTTHVFKEIDRENDGDEKVDHLIVHVMANFTSLEMDNLIREIENLVGVLSVIKVESLPLDPGAEKLGIAIL